MFSFAMTACFRVFPFCLLLIGSISFAQKAEEEKNDPKREFATLDEQISFHVNRLAKQEMQERMDFMHIVIEDISRLCDLEEKQTDSLVLAAKGASKRSMSRWHEQADRYFRTRVNGVDADTAREILSNVNNNVNFGGQGSDGRGELEELWKDTVESVLTKEQNEIYVSVTTARQQARIDAFADMAISSLDIYLRLTPEQRAKLFPIVKNSATEYLDDIQRYWGEYLEKKMLMSLINIEEPEKLKKILSEKQLSRLRSATTNLDHFWQERRRKRAAAAKKQPVKKDGDQKAEARPIGGAGRIVIKGAADGAVVIKPGAIFRGGNVQIEGGQIEIE